MPIYEYVCRDCGHQFEWLLRSDEKPSCPSCGRRRLAKQLSLPSAHVAGGSQPACPARQEGVCDVSDCRANRCGLGEWS